MQTHTDTMKALSSPEINNFKQFLERNINGAKVLSYSTRSLTALGDNYGSTMLAVTTFIQYGNKSPEKLELVAKMPPKNGQLREIFQISVTFIKENAIYTEMVPALRQLQIEMKVPEQEYYNIIARDFGARISLSNNSNIVDDNALLLLENLKVKGYRVGDRLEGFDAAHTKLILKALAKFHALPIALKYLKPHQFNTKLKPYLNKIDIDTKLDIDTRQRMNYTAIKEIRELNDFDRQIESIKTTLEICADWQKDLVTPPVETPFVTIVHNDFWVNNMMIQYGVNDEPLDVKLVDFQLTMYESLVHDLIFFMYTSVQENVLQNHFDELLRFYYDQFIWNLLTTGCCIDDFTYEKFLKEINRRAPYELFHIVIMLKVVYAKKESMPSNHEEYDNDMFFNDDLVGLGYFNRLKFVVAEFIKQNWILHP